MNSSFIAKQRPSNKIDFAYLYYLPFCRVFVSNDNLHSRTVPLFLKRGQKFITGVDLKAGLKELDEYYSNLPEEVKEKGVMNFASYPPRDVSTFIGQLFNELGWSWQKDAEEKGKGNILWPMRFALSGKDKSPDPFVIAEILGKEETVKRLKYAIQNI